MGLLLPVANFADLARPAYSIQFVAEHLRRSILAVAQDIASAVVRLSHAPLLLAAPTFYVLLGPHVPTSDDPLHLSDSIPVEVSVVRLGADRIQREFALESVGQEVRIPAALP